MTVRAIQTSFAHLIRAFAEAAGFVVMAGVVWGVGGMGGCQSTGGHQGTSRDIHASYSFGTLTCDLGADVRVEEVASAGEEALRLRGYSVSSRTVTSDKARLEGRSAGDGWLEKAVVESWPTARGVRIRIKIEPWGDDTASRLILDDMLVMLGR
ncbi:MAG: hypothetical protein KF768_11095 [Phycisphaeraceae bacterium]|nr:hypothetical protein [Phycisphaeraceae bacterium]